MYLHKSWVIFLIEYFHSCCVIGINHFWVFIAAIYCLITQPEVQNILIRTFWNRLLSLKDVQSGTVRQWLEPSPLAEKVTGLPPGSGALSGVCLFSLRTDCCFPASLVSSHRLKACMLGSSVTKLSLGQRVSGCLSPCVPVVDLQPARDVPRLLQTGCWRWAPAHRNPERRSR